MTKANNTVIYCSSLQSTSGGGVVDTLYEVKIKTKGIAIYIVSNTAKIRGGRA